MFIHSLLAVIYVQTHLHLVFKHIFKQHACVAFKMLLSKVPETESIEGGEEYKKEKDKNEVNNDRHCY